MYKQIAVILTLFVVVELFARTGAEIIPSTNYTDCGSVGTLKELRMTPCPTVPCDINKGTSLVIEIDFSPKEPTETLTTNVTGLIRDLEVPFRGIRVNACEDVIDATGKSECPVQDISKTYSYRTKLNVKASYPSLNLSVNWKLLDQKNEPVVCFRIPAKVIP